MGLARSDPAVQADRRSAFRGPPIAELPQEHHPIALQHAVQTLETMANEYWVLCSQKRGEKVLNVLTPMEGVFIHSHDESGPTARPVPSS